MEMDEHASAELHFNITLRFFSEIPSVRPSEITETRRADVMKALDMPSSETCPF